MIQPGTLPLVGHRWVPFKPYQIQFNDLDLTGATFTMTVRATRDAGSSLISITNSTSPAEGISIISASASATVIEIRINEATMEALPAAAAVGDDLDLFWDMHITPSGGTKAVYLEGPFTLRGGATQN